MIRLCMSVAYAPFIYFIVILISLSYNDAHKCVACQVLVNIKKLPQES